MPAVEFAPELAKPGCEERPDLALPFEKALGSVCQRRQDQGRFQNGVLGIKRHQTVEIATYDRFVAPNQPTDASAVTFTREYLMAFEQELVEAKDGAGLIEAMKGNIPKQDPKAGLGIAIEIGAKVAKGEMKWD